MENGNYQCSDKAEEIQTIKWTGCISFCRTIGTIYGYSYLTLLGFKKKHIKWVN
jgi:hypothetical protein